MSGSIEKILELASVRCDAADIYYQSSESRSVRFDNSRLKSVTSHQHSGLGLRVIREGRIGFASTTDLRHPEQVVDMAVESAQFGEKAAFELPCRFDGAETVKTCDSAVNNIAIETMVDMGLEALQMCTESNENYLFNADISADTGVERLLNSNGLDLSCESSLMSAGVDIEEVSDNGLLAVFEEKSWSRPFESIADLAQTALEKMRLGGRTAVAKPEKTPMLFAPKAVDNLLEPVIIALNGKLVQKGASALAGKIGEKLFDEKLSIYDDAVTDWAPGSSPFDGEGLKTGRMPLVEDGVVKNYMLDLQTSGLLGIKPTASGYRSFSSRPSPSSANTIVSAGTVKYDELVKNMKNGIIIDQTLGSGQSNTLAGDFSVNLDLGFLVKNGEIEGRLKDCMAAGNVYEVLAKIEALSAEQHWSGSGCMPSVYIEGLKLALDA